MSQKKTTEEFIEKAKKIHGSKYDYSKVNYVNNKIKVEIMCPEHGSFFQTPHNHLSLKRGCSECSGNRKSSTEQFIEKARKIHGNKYDYSKVNYANNHTKVEIICPEHGSFFQMPNNHVLLKRGCPICGVKSSAKAKESNTEEFIEKAKKIHGSKYDYSKVNYIDNKTKVEIICPKHGSFFQTPGGHLQGHGCCYCNTSRGEKAVENFLIENKIQFNSQKKFSDCRDKYSLPFDFYLPELNIIIEYNGIQHYESVEHFGGEKKLHLQRHHDWLKRKYCKDNNITLITISYNENVEEALKNILEN